MKTRCRLSFTFNISCIHWAIALAALALAFLSVPLAADCAEVTIAWDENSEDNIAGYKVYYGTASRDYSGTLSVGNTTQTSISNLQEGTTYYFAATAYDVDNNESGFSEELVYTVPVPDVTPDPHTISASADSNGTITPFGLISVEPNSNQTFTITPDPDYDILEVVVDGSSVGSVSTYTFIDVREDHTITASFIATSQILDSDEDGVPDHEDDFPFDPSESVDTDDDGEGNNRDEDDDNDGMPDTWELTYGLNPLVDDASDDPDGDGMNNLNEYYQGTAPNLYEGNFAPYPAELLFPADHEIVDLTPVLETGEFYDPNDNDLHGQSQWRINRADDEFCVFDVTSSAALTSLTVPKHILDEDTDYTWKVRFIDNHGTFSDWSEIGYFTTDHFENDSNGDGVPDRQEVNTPTDLDGDGTPDGDQDDMKCVSINKGKYQICVSIRDAEHVESIVSLEAEDPSDSQLVFNSKGKPNFIEFELINFKLYVDEPGVETMVTIHLSKPAYKHGICYKYDPVDDVWVNYSEYTDFSEHRKTVYLYLTDGGFGDADGIANGIIVDPLAFGSDTDPNIDASGSSGSSGDSFPNISCFISAALDGSRGEEPFKIWREIRGRELSIIFGLIVLAIIGKAIARQIIRDFKARLITT